MCPLSHIRVPQSTYHFVKSWLVRPFRKAGPALKERTWDIMPEDRSTIERSIWTARPTRLVQTARESIDSWLGVSGAEILLIDALLTQLTVNSLRNARRSGAGPAEAAELANEIVYSQHGGTQHSSTLLLRVALSTGEAEVIDAGSPRMFRVRRGEIEPVKLDQQMPLGMFGDTRYRVQPVSFLAGDRLIILSDGLYEARGPSGRVYGQAPLTAALRSSRRRSTPGPERDRALPDHRPPRAPRGNRPGRRRDRRVPGLARSRKRARSVLLEGLRRLALQVPHDVAVVSAQAARHPPHVDRAQHPDDTDADRRGVGGG